MKRRSYSPAIVLALMVSLIPTQPLKAAYLVPTPPIAPGLSPICTLEVESLAEIACLFGVITVIEVAHYLHLKRCLEQAREKRIRAEESDTISS